MIAFIGTARRFSDYCKTELKMNPRQAFNQKVAIMVHEPEQIRGYKGPITIVDTGELSNVHMLRAIYEEIDMINAMVPGE